MLHGRIVNEINMKQLYLLLMACGMYSTLQAQQTYTGIADAVTREALPGVSVHLLHRSGGCTTDARGQFHLSYHPADTLEISYTGYATRQISGAQLTAQRVIYLQPQLTSLNEVVISTSRDRQQRTDAPVAISTVSAQTLKETKATTLDQVLNKVSGVYMVNLGNEQHTMAIRQPIGYRSLFLYMEDGIPIRTTGDFNHNALIEINGAALRNIEIIRGPASSLYGSEAVGGAVNFITASPTLVPTARIQAEASNQGYRRTDFSLSNTLGETGLYIGGYYAGQHNGYMDHSDFHKLALTIKSTHQLNEKNSITNMATIVRYKTDQTGGLDSAHFYGKDYRSFHTFSYRKVDALRLRSTWNHTWNTVNRTTFTAYYRNNTIAQNPFYAIKSTSNPLRARGEINSDAFQSFGMVIQHKKDFGWKQAALIAGVSVDYSPATYYATFIDVSRNAEGFFTGYRPTDSVLTDYRAGLLNTAAYAQLELSPIQRLKLVAALRYDRMDYDFDNHLPASAFTGAPDERNNFNAYTPKLGATYDFGRNRGVYANYSVGFAPPGISELYRGMKVPVLQPATYRNYEAGGWTSFAAGKGDADISIYEMKGTHEIISVQQADGSYENRNAGKTTHRGVEWNVKYTPLPGIFLRCSGTYAEHIFNAYTENGKNYDNKTMNGAPKVITNTEITWKPSFIPGFRLGGEWQHVGKYYMDPGNTTVYNGYDLINIRAGYTFHGLECWVNCINAGDRIYATTAEKSAWGKSYRPGPRQAFHFGVGYTFTGKKKYL